MLIEPGKNDDLPKPTMGTWLAIISRIGWGLLILFGMIGVLAGEEMGAYVIVLTSIMWISIKILTEAMFALSIGKLIISNKEEDKDNLSK